MRKVSLLFIICISLLLAGCPSSRADKYKQVYDTSKLHNNSVIVYKGDSIEIDLRYVHFFGRKKDNGIFGGLKFLSEKPVNTKNLVVKITSNIFGTIPQDTLPKKHLSLYHLKHPKTERVLDTSNLLFHRKTTGFLSHKKRKKDTITLSINNKNYLFSLATPK